MMLILVARSIESELIPVCRRYGLDVVIYNGWEITTPCMTIRID